MRLAPNLSLRQPKRLSGWSLGLEGFVPVVDGWRCRSRVETPVSL